MKKIRIYFLALIAVLFAACGGNSFKVTGHIEGANDSTQMVLEVANNGLWLIADSVTPDENGKFSVSLPAPAHAEIYRLRYMDKAICFPVDSIDNIAIKSNMETFATGYSLSGSTHAEDMMKVDKKAMHMHGASEEDMKAWKRELSEQILMEPSSIVAYYIINKYIGEEPLFNPYNKEDMKIIGAVANAYNTFKSSDPRTDYLVALAMNSRKLHEVNVKQDTVVVDEVPLIDIELQDNNGAVQKLSDVAAQGKVVLVNFTVYSDELSPAFNKILADEYGKYKSRGLEIYQIAYDTDEFQWRQAAKNLPWITVYDENGVNSKYLALYNVGGFPALFVLNRKGELVERVIDIEKLSSTLAKYM